jgi:hypothetical protein
VISGRGFLSVCSFLFLSASRLSPSRRSPGPTFLYFGSIVYPPQGLYNLIKAKPKAVETLRPTRKQLEDFNRKQPATPRVEPAQLRCLMVFDTQTREFVGSGCYVVSTAPSVGEVAGFETVSAEFVGREKL